MFLYFATLFYIKGKDGFIVPQIVMNDTVKIQLPMSSFVRRSATVNENTGKKIKRVASYTDMKRQEISNKSIKIEVQKPKSAPSKFERKISVPKSRAHMKLRM